MSAVISIEDMRKSLKEFCENVEVCKTCVLCKPGFRCGRGAHFLTRNSRDEYDMSDLEIMNAYKIAIEEAK